MWVTCSDSILHNVNGSRKCFSTSQTIPGIPQQPSQAQEKLAKKENLCLPVMCVDWMSLYLMLAYLCPVWENRGREEYNLDSDYQQALMQEEGNVSMATETTSQCHVKLVLVSQQTEGSHCAPAWRAACNAPHRVATCCALTAIDS